MYLFAIVFAFNYSVSMAQITNKNKPLLAAKDMSYWSETNNWIQISGQANISNDGKYAFYKVANETKGRETLHVCSTSGNWEKKMEGTSDVHFSCNSKLIVGKNSDGNIFILQLGTDKMETITATDQFELVNDGLIDRLVYITTDHKLHIRDISSKKEKIIEKINKFIVSPNGKKIVISKLVEENGHLYETATWVDLSTNKSKIIWNKGEISSFVFNIDGNRVAFVINNQIDKRGIWVYDELKNETIDAVNESMLSPWKDFVLMVIESFDKDQLYFQMSPTISELKKGVDVYSYTDTLAMTMQLNRVKNPFTAGFSFLVLADIKSRKIQQLTKDFERFTRLNIEYGVVSYSNGNSKFKDERPTDYLISLQSGKRVKLPYELCDGSPMSLDQKKLILRSSYKDGEPNLFTYEISTGLLRNITEFIPIPNPDIRRIFSDSRVELLAYIEGTNCALISDTYDIWRIDLNGKEHPINITNGYGRQNMIAFGFADINYKNGSLTIPDLKKQTLILTSVNYQNKDNDFYSISSIKNASQPRRLTFGGYIQDYSKIKYFAPHCFPAPLAKAKDKNIFIFTRTNATHSLNYFVTTDFKKVRPISNVRPELNYNWLTVELVEFKNLEGKTRQGLLYKPENFDKNKKYPIIFNYYQYSSEDLNSFSIPYVTYSGKTNLPFYVSNGYLVFIPDIPIVEGTGYTEAFNSVMGAANYFAAKNYIDPGKMAVMGHSHGGGETNFIVTHSNIFAAAVATAGPTDPIGKYGLPVQGRQYPYFFENVQENIKGSLYSNLKDYIKYSSKLAADKVTTPLLLMYNEGDIAVSFSDGLSFFNQLWKQGKRAWLLQYDGEGHGVTNRENAEDYMIREKQFLDHYLKDAPAPKWMTRGIPALKKGIENGYGVDPEIKTPMIINTGN